MLNDDVRIDGHIRPGQLPARRKSCAYRKICDPVHGDAGQLDAGKSVYAERPGNFDDPLEIAAGGDHIERRLTAVLLRQAAENQF